MHTPDQIAECTIGLTSAMCRRLWSSIEANENQVSSFECDDYAWYLEANEIRNVWNFFTPEEQHTLNVHAEIYEDLREKAEAISESFECDRWEGEKLVMILALIEKGQLSEDATAEELADRHLALETFADLKQFLDQVTPL